MTSTKPIIVMRHDPYAVPTIGKVPDAPPISRHVNYYSLPEGSPFQFAAATPVYSPQVSCDCDPHLRPSGEPELACCVNEEEYCIAESDMLFAQQYAMTSTADIGSSCANATGSASGPYRSAAFRQMDGAAIERLLRMHDHDFADSLYFQPHGMAFSGESSETVSVPTATEGPCISNRSSSDDGALQVAPKPRRNRARGTKAHKSEFPEPVDTLLSSDIEPESVVRPTYSDIAKLTPISNHPSKEYERETQVKALSEKREKLSDATDDVKDECPRRSDRKAGNKLETQPPLPDVNPSTDEPQPDAAARKKKKKNADGWILSVSKQPKREVKAPTRTVPQKQEQQSKAQQQKAPDEEENVVFAVPKPANNKKKSKRCKKEKDEDFEVLLSELRNVKKEPNPKQVQERSANGALLRAFMNAMTAPSTKGFGESSLSKNPSRTAEALRECLERASLIKFNPSARLIVLQQAMAIFERATPGSIPVELRGELMFDMADATCEQLDVERARIHAEQALDAAYESGSKHLEMLSHLVIGKIHENLVQPEEAKLSLDRVIELATELSDQRQEACARCHLGTVMELLGNFSEAFREYYRALSIAMGLKDKHMAVDIRSNIGVAWLSTAELPVAFNYLSTIAPVSVAMKDSGIVNRVFTNLSYYYVLIGAPHKALDVYDQALEFAKSENDVMCIAQTLSSIGSTFRLLRRYPEALEAFQQELNAIVKTGYKPRIAETYNNIGATYREMGAFGRARQFHTKELELARSSKDVVVESKAQLALGLVDFGEGNTEKCINHVFESLLLLETIDPVARRTHLVKVGCTEIEWKALDSLERAFVSQGKFIEAAQCADRKHVSVLAEQLDQQLKPRRTTSSIVCEQIQTLEQYISSKFLPIAEIKQLCCRAKVAAIVMYSTFWEDFDEVYTYVIKDDGTVHHTAKTLTKEVMHTLAAHQSTYRKKMSGWEYDTPLLPHKVAVMSELPVEKCDQIPLESHMQHMYNMFIEPIDELLPEKDDRAVCFVSDGLIANVPFHALFSSRRKCRLIESWPTTEVPSIACLSKLSKINAAAEQAASAAVDESFKNAEVAEEKCITVIVDQLKNLPLNEEMLSRCNIHELVSSCNSSQASMDAVVEELNEVTGNVWIHLPATFDVRDDFCGTLCVEHHDSVPRSEEDPPMQQSMEPEHALSKYSKAAASRNLWETLRAHDLVNLVNMSRTRLLVNTGFSSFTFRIIHETCVTLSRAFFASGVSRVVGCLWHSKHPAFHSILSEMASIGSDNPSENVQFALCRQRLLIKAIQHDVPLEAWVPFVYSGLP